jgi:hypothetical protein
VVGKALGVVSPVERDFGALMERVMPVRRRAAEWGRGLVCIHNARSASLRYNHPKRGYKQIGWQQLGYKCFYPRGTAEFRSVTGTIVPKLKRPYGR